MVAAVDLVIAEALLDLVRHGGTVVAEVDGGHRGRVGRVGDDGRGGQRGAASARQIVVRDGGVLDVDAVVDEDVEDAEDGLLGGVYRPAVALDELVVELAEADAALPQLPVDRLAQLPQAPEEVGEDEAEALAAGAQEADQRLI